ncbi:hypothetical protein S7711_08850 [Stachybotrys chartarum IBT 7711]|uniref:Cyclin-dependent kinase n=1 Tax=Stachybotrys chartarum (strain CBS 109288 / IBT 7711) TaxID=1280523 RepID=A0A084AHR3_STACB|nr:hypothetical protein S7711_08850 [Stachybotrys chartarum IBT 7711]KFA55781.1 hypothetical protein S40293_01899 [Stachybotrys chartarum IBT 40293]
MEATSPTKRRALAPMDANATLSSPKTHLKATPSKSLAAPTAAATASMASAATRSPLRQVLDGKKRAALDESSTSSPAPKKTCLEREEEDVVNRSRSQSVDSSSIFDSSAGDASWATAATDPDSAAAAAPRPTITRPRALTREQAREKAEILRLRLGLASYKLRTGQTTVPLADLQVRPLPPRTRSAPSVPRVFATSSQESQPETSRSRDTRERKDEKVGEQREEWREAGEFRTSRRQASPAESATSLSSEKPSMQLPHLSPAKEAAEIAAAATAAVAQVAPRHQQAASAGSEETVTEPSAGAVSTISRSQSP